MHRTPHPIALDFAQVEWGDDGVHRSPVFGDVYHAIAGAVGQCEHVFIDGNRLRERWTNPGWLAIGELGFGSGLNFLVTAARWMLDTAPDARLAYVAVEKYLWSSNDAARLFATAFAAVRKDTDWCSALNAITEEWMGLLPTLTVGSNRLVLAGGRIQLTLHVGDINHVLPQMRGRVDAWYLDGFNPRANAAMWAQPLWAHLARLSRKGCTVASWCCAGDVRRGLQQAGFHIGKAPGFAHKREMLIGQMSSGHEPVRPSRVEVVGAGLAGCWTAAALAERGVQAVLLDKRMGPGRAASSMPMMMIRPFARHRDTPTARFFWQAAHYAVHRMRLTSAESWVEQPIWRQHGDEEAAWLAPAGTVDGAELCDRLSSTAAIIAQWNSDVPFVEGAACRSNLRVFCSGQVPRAVSGEAVALRPIRGQQSLWLGAPRMLGAHSPRVGDCVASEREEGLYFGATYRFDDEHAEVIPDEALDYGARLPMPPGEENLAEMRHWAGVRWQSRDRLPLCGPAPDEHAAASVADIGRADASTLPGQSRVWLNIAHGSRGATSSPLTAALVADRMLDLPEPLLAGESEALDPRRFWLRDWRRGRWPRPVSSVDEF